MKIPILFSALCAPKFADPAKCDYRLTPDSPGYAGLSSDGTPVGARNMPGLYGDQSL